MPEKEIEYKELYLQEFNEKHKYKSILRTLYTDCPDMIWVKDLEGRYIWGNSRLITGLLGKKSLADIVGKTDLELAASSDTDSTAGESCTSTDKITMLKGTDQRMLEEFLIDNELIVLEVIKSVIRDGNGDIIGTTGVARDVTRLNEMLNELTSGLQCERVISNPIDVIYDSVHKVGNNG